MKINLVSRFVDVDLMCMRCADETETVEHALRECHWARELWHQIGLPIIFSDVVIPVWLLFVVTLWCF